MDGKKSLYKPTIYKRETRDDSDDEGGKQNDANDSRKRRHDDDARDKKSKKSDSERPNGKRAKTDEASVAGYDNGVENPRRRTRSLSDAEEKFHITPAQSPEEFRSLHQITVVGRDEQGHSILVCPDPMTTFASTPFPTPIRKALESAGFSNPTPTQAQSWPIALQGRDIVTVAKTGSGKTCGFLMPAFHRLLKDTARRRGPPGILVLAPTRELACQIEEEAVKFGRSSFIRSACAYGGAPKGLQMRKIQQGIEILIATPGRLNDLLEMRAVDLSKILFLVLDEADRM